MRRSVIRCQRLLRASWHQLPHSSPATRPRVRRFSSSSNASPPPPPSSSSSSSTSSDARFTDPSLYSSSHLSSSIYPSPSGQTQQPLRHLPYVAYQSEYDDPTTDSTADDTGEPTATSPPSTSTPPPPHPLATSPTSADSADVDSSSMVSAINQLTIEGLRNESATGPATIHNKPLHAKYKPTSRRATTHHITPTHGTLTTLQLHRLLSLYALTGAGSSSGGGGEGRHEVVSRLAGRFGVDVGLVEQLVQSMAVGRVYNESTERGGVNPADVGKDQYAVWREDEVPPGRRAVVQGAHLVTHLQAWERETADKQR